jgi:hypothetical protein
LELTLIPDSTGSAEGGDLVTGEAKALEAYDGLSTAMTWLEDAEEDDEDGDEGYDIEGGEFSGDWIWEGNVDDVGRFEDVEIPAEKLGDGAGVIRPREEDEHAEGVEGEAKWRKTG